MLPLGKTESHTRNDQIRLTLILWKHTQMHKIPIIDSISRGYEMCMVVVNFLSVSTGASALLQHQPSHGTALPLWGGSLRGATVWTYQWDESLNMPGLWIKLQQSQQMSAERFIFNKLSSARMPPRFSVSYLRCLRCTGVQKSNGQTSAFISWPWKSYISHLPCIHKGNTTSSNFVLSFFRIT